MDLGGDGVELGKTMLAEAQELGGTVGACPQGLFVFNFFEWACQDFWLLKANLGPLCMPHPGMGPLV